MKNPVSSGLVTVAAILTLSCQGNPSGSSTVGPSEPVTFHSFRADGSAVEGVAEDGVVTLDNASPVLTLHTHPPAVNGKVWTTGLVTFNLCDSTDPDQNPDHPELGDTLNWQFHFGDSGTPAFNPDGTFNADVGHVCRTEHTYVEGRYTATVTVTDQHLEDQGHDVSSLARTTQTITVIASSEPPPVAGGCYDGHGTYYDQSFNGHLNRPGNAVVWYSDDGTCTTRYFPAMWVRTDATTPGEVRQFCNTISGGYHIVLQLVEAGFRVPNDIWACG
jgi:hypothetical protein